MSSMYFIWGYKLTDEFIINWLPDELCPTCGKDINDATVELVVDTDKLREMGIECVMAYRDHSNYEMYIGKIIAYSLALDICPVRNIREKDLLPLESGEDKFELLNTMNKFLKDNSIPSDECELGFWMVYSEPHDVPVI